MFDDREDIRAMVASQVDPTAGQVRNYKLDYEEAKATGAIPADMTLDQYIAMRQAQEAAAAQEQPTA